ncbi:hypothetical protein [Alicyclobacillus vulcanalis]|uniref:Cytochrome C and Quinol oxidase polypeptide I n=1 Tax=Alicyclobacillus vulcanalis TaxID=252246 RepID=A0A1N7ME74_9BACL|nr:hypothetical protein [Alicyclobacillus vulcanalis]SIS84347.1 hypothetical protein SAMN05421799_10582 [Alicyclobacillus vulcanalis]
MGHVHMVFGVVLILLAIIATIWELATQRGLPRALRGVVIGLFDLQILLGIITWLIRKPGWSFVLHPIIMIVAVIVLHVLTSPSAPRSRRLTGWVVATVLFIVGAAIYRV